MRQRTLGQQGLQVSTLGLGCMGMSEFYGTADESESIASHPACPRPGDRLPRHADMYGPSPTSGWSARALHDRRDEVIIATKFGVQRNDRVSTWASTAGPNTCALL